MSYTLTLDCGCRVFVACDPVTHTAHTRILERRGPACQRRMHRVGRKMFLWELLPDHGTASSPAAPDRVWA